LLQQLGKRGEPLGAQVAEQAPVQGLDGGVEILQQTQCGASDMGCHHAPVALLAPAGD